MTDFSQTGRAVHGDQRNITGPGTRPARPPSAPEPRQHLPMMPLGQLRIGLAEFFPASTDLVLQHLTHLATGINEPIARSSRDAGDYLNRRVLVGQADFTTKLADQLNYYQRLPHLAGAVASMPDDRKTALNHLYADTIHRTAHNISPRTRELLTLHMHSTYLHELNATGDPRAGKEMVDFVTRRSTEIDRAISKPWMDYYLAARPELPHSPPLSAFGFAAETERIRLLYDATVPELLEAGAAANRERDPQWLLAVLEGLEARQPEQPAWSEAAEKVRTIAGEAMVAVAELNLDEPFQPAFRQGHPADLAAEGRAATTAIPTTTPIPDPTSPNTTHTRHR
ncbi:hypothetical protein AB0I28_33045 [Phytomonospora sp. NPDC050363]|uniref:hypothetical protein n=1 Tax=Phytomonospora sp. NPDC050363 TaxID=3155642 RepID=UPI0033C7E938